MFGILPEDTIRIIYEYDNSKKILFEKVLDEYLYLYRLKTACIGYLNIIHRKRMYFRRKSQLKYGKFNITMWNTESS